MKNRALTIALFVFLLKTMAVCAESKHYDLGIAPGVDRAVFDVWRPEAELEGVLLLIPGQNGDGSQCLKSPKWIEFCRDNHLALVGVTFISDDRVMEQGKGYSHPALGSGELIQKGLKKAGLEGKPLFLHGFSAGAQFVARYTELFPENVQAWSAYSSASRDQLQTRNPMPPGIVSCGELDASRYGTALTYFKEGRVLGRKWTWVSVREKGHEVSPELEDFVRKYFSEILHEPNLKGVWADAQTFQIRAEPNAADTELSWLPSLALLEVMQSFSSH